MELDVYIDISFIILRRELLFIVGTTPTYYSSNHNSFE